MTKFNFIAFFLITLLFAFDASAGRGVFDSNETKSKNLKPFFKWTGMVKRYDKRHKKEQNCKPSKITKCHREKWENFLHSIKNKDVTSQIKAVNSHMNQSEYILDIINWGIQDYWATPYQFFVKDGDCEDYAIAKYMSLKALGYPEDKMRIVVLNDTNLGVIHAVLAVYTNNDILILDNQITKTVSASKIHHYVPIYSINESAWWRHR